MKSNKLLDKAKKMNKKELEEKLDKALKRIDKLEYVCYFTDEPCKECNKKEIPTRLDTIEEKLLGWNKDEWNIVDDKLDALYEHFNLEFVDKKENISDGSDKADIENNIKYARKKTNINSNKK